MRFAIFDEQRHISNVMNVTPPCEKLWDNDQNHLQIKMSATAKSPLIQASQQITKSTSDYLPETVLWPLRCALILASDIITNQQLEITLQDEIFVKKFVVMLNLPPT